MELFGLIELRVVMLLFIHWRLKLADVHHLLTFFFTKQLLPLFWKSPASSRQLDHNSSRIVVCHSMVDNYDAVLTLQDMCRLLTFFFTEQLLPLFRKILVSSRQPNTVSCRIVEASRIVFCRSTVDNYDDVSTLQDVGRLLMFFFT
jgi:c-di-AMP phosphodiesterase-like protein